MSCRLLLALLVSVFLVACNSSGGSGSKNKTNQNDPLEISGAVADGYLVGATVCLDLNGNRACDEGEPSGISGVGGVFTFQVSGGVNLSAHRVVVEVADSTLDEDTGLPVGKPYVLTAPAGVSEFISPLTTAIQALLERNPAMTPEEAAMAVGSEIGVGAGVDMFADYIAAKEQGGAEAEAYARLHRVAQVLAKVLAENHEAIMNAALLQGIPQSNYHLLLALVENQLLQQLATAATAVDSAGEDFDINDVVVTIADTDDLDQQIDAGPVVGLAGAWAMVDDDGARIAMVFFADGSYVMGQDGGDGPGGQDGLERGTYQWNPLSGAFTSTCPSVDTNGEWGLSHSVSGDVCTGVTADLGVTAVISGNALEFDFGDGDIIVLDRVEGPTNSIFGAWSFTEGDANVVLVFLPNGEYWHFEDGNSDPNGQDGIERGTYLWEEASGFFNSNCPETDTNGQWGLSHPNPPGCSGTEATVTVVNNEALIFDIFEDDLVILRKVDTSFVTTEGYTLDLAGRTATSVITSGNCPGAALGWAYTFTDAGVTAVGTDTTIDCVPGEEEEFSLTWAELAQIGDIPFNCSGTTCTFEALNTTTEGIDEDGRPFRSIHWHMPGKTLIYIKSITGGPEEGDSWKEFITLQ